MAAASSRALALLEIVLLLSMHPIAAHRSSEVEAMVTGLGATHMTQHVLAREALERALHEDATNGTRWLDWKFWAGCGDRKKDFEERSRTLKSRYEQAIADGHMDASEASWVILQARHVAKTLQSAQKKGCSWTKGSGETDMTAMSGLLSETAPKQPCFGVAKKQLEDATGADAGRQKAAFLQAMGTLLSKTSKCTAVAVEEPSDDAVKSALESPELAEEEEEEAVELAYDAGQYEKDKLAAGLRRGGSLFEDGELQETELGFVGLLATVLVYIVPAIMWVMQCKVLSEVLMMVVGLVLCIFQQIALILVKQFGGKLQEVAFGDCAKFWIGALQKKEKLTELGTDLAACAVKVMVAGR